MMNGSSDVVAAWHLSKSSIITTGFWAIRWLQINQVVDSDLEQLKKQLDQLVVPVFYKKRGLPTL